MAVSVPTIPIGTLAVNTTSGVTGLTDPDDLAVVGDPATDELRIGFLTLDKFFDGPVKAGDNVDLTFTLTNLDSAAASDLGFTDDLDAVVSGLAATGLPVAACGGTLSTSNGGSTIILVGASLAAAGSPGDSCSFPVTLLVPGGAPFGTFTNTTGDLVQSGISIGDPAVADLEIEPTIDFSKVFLPDTIGPSSTSLLEFTISNLDSGQLAEDVAFTDVLPAGVVIATPSSMFSDCADGVLSAPDGGNTISLTGARLGAGATCSVTVNVTPAAPGVYDNETGELTSAIGGGGTATATLTVDAARPGFSKSFSPSSIPLGATSILTFTFDNSANASGVGNLNFNDVLPSGMMVATPTNAASDCGTAPLVPLITAEPGATTIFFTADGFLPTFPAVGAESTCTFSVDVTTQSTGIFDNGPGIECRKTSPDVR